MFVIQKNFYVGWKHRRLLSDLYMRQKVVIRIANEESDPGTTGPGVRQGCQISPLLFSIYAEVKMIEAMENGEEEIVVGGQVVRGVRFAEDQGVVSSSEDGLQRLMDRMNDTANRFIMMMNVQKIKTMIVSRDEEQVVNITINGQRVEQVRNFKYLGSNISEDGYNLVDVKTRIACKKGVQQEE